MLPDNNPFDRARPDQEIWTASALLDRYRACYRSLHEETVAESGHMMHLDQPKKFARAIESFPY